VLRETWVPETNMLHVDGSMGEGGGQVLRTALALSLLTAQPFRIENIRARRRNPGLAAQHLAAVKAAATIGSSRVEGGVKGSTALTFEPGPVRPGRYRFDVGTAGSTSLVLQTVFLPLALGREPSDLVLEGGTHVPWSPCFHYLALQWAPALAGLGAGVDLELETPGFYPKGGGRVRALVRPAERALDALHLPVRGELLRLRVISGVSNLDRSIAERQARRAAARVEGLGVPASAEVLRFTGPSAGTFLVLLAEFVHARFCATALGERGKPAEAVADEAAGELLAFLATDEAMEPHLADQLLLPLALAAGTSEFTVARVTRHLLTNAEVIRIFLPAAQVEVQGSEEKPGRVGMRGAGLSPAGRRRKEGAG
jgi:RNA 3'-phosphate cyclase